MPSGKFGLPRPFASGDVVLLTTVDDSQLVKGAETQLESILRNRSDITIKGVEYHSSINTFGTVIGLDSVELNDLNDLSEMVEDVIGAGSVEGHSVGFR